MPARVFLVRRRDVTLSRHDLCSCTWDNDTGFALGGFAGGTAREVA